MRRWVAVGCLALLLGAPVTSAIWQREPVSWPDDEDQGKVSALALDGDGHPHIVYYFEENPPLDYGYKYARWNGTTWSHSLVVSGQEWFGERPEIEIDSAGRPWIALWSSLLVHWDGSSWQSESVEGGYGVDLVLDSLDRPHLSFMGVSGHDDELRYARWDGAAWQIETVDTVTSDRRSTAIRLDSLDRPRIAFGDASLRYAAWDGAAWQIETVDIDYPSRIDLALSTSEEPHIVCRNMDPYGPILWIHHMHRDGATWSGTTLPWAGDVVPSHLALDSMDRPRVALCQWRLMGIGEIRCARWDGSAWQGPLLFRTDYYWTPEFIGLAIGPDDTTHVSFRSGLPDWGLHYAWEVPSPPSPTPSPIPPIIPTTSQTGLWLLGLALSLLLGAGALARQ